MPPALNIVVVPDVTALSILVQVAQELLIKVLQVVLITMAHLVMAQVAVAAQGQLVLMELLLKAETAVMELQYL